MRDGKVALVFAGDERDFRLPIESLLALEDACDAAVSEIASRLAAGRWRVRDVRETLRLGLIGGGTAPKAAAALVDLGAGPGDLVKAAVTARIVLFAALVSEEPEDDAGKAERADAPEAESASPPAPSSEPAPSSATRPTKLDA